MILSYFSDEEHDGPSSTSPNQLTSEQIKTTLSPAAEEKNVKLIVRHQRMHFKSPLRSQMWKALYLRMEGKFWYFWSWVYNAILRTQKFRICRVKKFAWFCHIFDFKLSIRHNLIISLYFLEILSINSQKTLKNSLLNQNFFKIHIKPGYPWNIFTFYSHLIISLYFLKILSIISQKTF